MIRDGTDKALITDLDRRANTAHLKGQYFHVQEQWKSALSHYEEALAAYDELAVKYPHRANPVEIDFGKQHMEDAGNERQTGSDDSADANSATSGNRS